MSNPSSLAPHFSRTTPSGSAGIVGAGLMGRLLALMLVEQGWQVTLFDLDDTRGRQSCGFTGAGMLAPLSELESSEPLIAQLGIESLTLWENLLRRFQLPVFFQREGTLVVAHHLDAPDLAQFSRMLQCKLAQADLPKSGEFEDIQWLVSPNELKTLEPQLAGRFPNALFIPGEGQIDNRQLMPALAQALAKRGVCWQANREIRQVHPHAVDDGDEVREFDWVIDCRGLGAKTDLPALRGVRGEIVRVHAPEVALHRPIRLMHPRHPIYIVPRENQHFLIGATSIESEDFRPITLQSGMELLSAAFTVHPGFAEASIQEMNVNCRPALPDNLPRIQVEPGLMRINGLYRHGFLIAPRLAELASRYLSDESLPEADITPALFEFENQKESRAYAIAD